MKLTFSLIRAVLGKGHVVDVRKPDHNEVPSLQSTTERRIYRTWKWNAKPKSQNHSVLEMPRRELEPTKSGLYDCLLHSSTTKNTDLDKW